MRVIFTRLNKLATLLLALSFCGAAHGKQDVLCRNLFGSYSEDDRVAALERLKALGPTGEIAPHEVEIKGGKGFVKIGHIDYKQREYIVALRDALNMGAVSEIDGGLVVGPRVLPWFKKLSEMTLKGEPVKLHGLIAPAMLKNQMMRGAKTQNPQSRGERVVAFSEKEIKEFYETAKELGLVEACRKHYGSVDPMLGDCFHLKFTLHSNDVTGIRWEKWVKPKNEE